MTQTATRFPTETSPVEKANGLPIARQATILGLVLYGIAMILAVLVTVIGDPGFMTVYFAINLAITVALIGLVRRVGAWALWLTAALMFLNLAANGQFMIPGFRFPASFFDFTIALFSVAGSVITLGGAIVALVARRRQATRSAPTRTERLAAGGTVAALAALAALSGVLTLANRDSVPAEAKVGALPVRMKATKFEQTRLEARTGQPVRLLIRNDDPGAHSFTLEALGADVIVGPRSEQLITIPAAQPGEYAYVCRLFSHEQVMKGTLVVTP